MDDILTKRTSRPDGASRIGPLLLASAVVVPCLLLAAAVVRWWPEDEAVDGLRGVAVVAVLLAAGITSAGLLLGLWSLLRGLRQLRAAVTRLEEDRPIGRGDAGEHAAAPPLLPPTPASREAIPAHASRPPAPGVGDLASAANQPSAPKDNAATADRRWEEVLSILSDIRENSLLSDEERLGKRHQQAEQEVAQTLALARSLLTGGDLARAGELAEQLRARHPQDGRATALVQEVQEARNRRESAHAREARRQVDDLVSISAWQRAREVAQRLLDKYPDSVQARQLLERVDSDQKQMEGDQRRRLYTEIQRSVTRRKWEEALAAARSFLERFPTCEETEALRQQLTTLETNAQIEARQKLEAQIMDLVKHGRYLEATELARKVIERYPGSPQAEALRTQLDRLEQLANDPSAPRARVRFDG